MKYTTALLLASSAKAISVNSGPDVYGPNGDNYTNESADYDLSRIGVSVTHQGNGPKCTRGDWAVVHWKGSLNDGRVVTDSHSEGLGYPKTFAVGNAEVFKCWDLVLPQLNQGDKATVSCPSYYAYGGAYTISPLGGEPIPLHSDITFDLEVEECARHPDSFDGNSHSQPHTTTLQPGRCFYLHSKTGMDQNIDQVLTGRFDSALNKDVLAIEHQVYDDKDQQWYYNENDKSLYNAAHPSLVVDYSNGKEKMTLSEHGFSSQTGGFDYQDDQILTPEGLALSVNHTDYSVVTIGNEKENGQFWHVEYCYLYNSVMQSDLPQDQ